MTNRSIIIITLLAVIFCFLSVLIFTVPAFTTLFNLSTDNNANIGSAIGGITAPILGLFSTVLLILTLNKQIESIKDQKLKNESDVIFSLLNQLENELATVYYTYNSKTKDETGKLVTKEIKLTGVEALNEWTRKYRREKRDSPETFRFGHFYQSNQILLIVHSFQLIQKRIEVATVREDLKALFGQKLKSFYECRLYYPLNKIHEALDIYPREKDSISKELETFYEEMEAKRTSPPYEEDY